MATPGGVGLVRELGGSVMAFHRARAIAVLLALASVTIMAGAEETIPEARIEATIPQLGFVMGVGFDSLWMMNLATSKARSH